MAKLVNATKGKITVTDALLELKRLHLITVSPTPVVLPYWVANFELSADTDVLSKIQVSFPYEEGKDPLKEAYKVVKANDVEGWSLSKFDNFNTLVGANLAVVYNVEAPV
jgi:hypothetical protein